MPGEKKFGPQYLQGLLRANPDTAEDLAMQKAKIEEYFRSQARSTEKREVPVPAASRAASPAPARARQSAGADSASQIKYNRALKETRYRRKLLLTWSILLSAPALLMLSKRTGAMWLLPLLLAFIGFYLWRTRKGWMPYLMLNLNMLNHNPRNGHTIATTRAIVRGMVNSKSQHWSRAFGESPVPEFQEKWSSFNQNLEHILKANTLAEAFGPAEECLSIINYFEQVKKKHLTGKIADEQLLETDIDPVNTLIEKLCEEHEWDHADKLSQHYLLLLNPDQNL